MHINLLVIPLSRYIALHGCIAFKLLTFFFRQAGKRETKKGGRPRKFVGTQVHTYEKTGGGAPLWGSQPGE